ncbi:MAG: hypothetical protein FJZ49_04135 [Candidatus Verstraetearchaeota archaeon]|nr:hypothetical protein [Candidatus Verstraetearchaeota archaeon]
MHEFFKTLGASAFVEAIFVPKEESINEYIMNARTNSLLEPKYVWGRKERVPMFIDAKRLMLYGEPGMRKWAGGWYLLVWVVLGFLALLSGVISGNAVTMIVGTVIVFAATLAYPTSYVE